MELSITVESNVRSCERNHTLAYVVKQLPIGCIEANATKIRLCGMIAHYDQVRWTNKSNHKNDTQLVYWQLRLNYAMSLT